MSKPIPDHPRARTGWLSAAAVAGFCTVLIAGIFSLQHFTASGRHERVVRLPAYDRDLVETQEPRLIRPGGRGGSIVLSASDITGSEDFLLLAERDPKAAAAVIARLEDSPTRDERLYDLMQIWIGRDPHQAADWVTQLPIGGLKNDATAELGLAWGKADPAAASRWVDENIFTQNAPAGAASLTSAWARKDIAAASEWVSTLDVDAPARREAIKTLAFHLGELDPQRGLAWIARLKPADRKQILVNFTASWSDRDPAAAASWLRYQAAGFDQVTRDQASLAVIHSWANSDAPAASRWIGELEDGDLKENAKATFAETYAETAPAEALPWAEDIDDPERRLEATMVVYEEWILKDKETFKSEIRNRWATLGDSLRHEIYDLLLDHDQEFKNELFRLLDERDGEE
jgi:hypothetical protein